VNGQNVGAEYITVSGAGVGGQGAIVNSGGGNNNATRFVTLAGRHVRGVGRWDVRATPPLCSRAMGIPHQGGVNQMTFVQRGRDALGDVSVAEGILAFEVSSTLAIRTRPSPSPRTRPAVLWSDGRQHLEKELDRQQRHYPGFQRHGDQRRPDHVVGQCHLRYRLGMTFCQTGLVTGAGALYKANAAAWC